jgi:hypothetical protein
MSAPRVDRTGRWLAALAAVALAAGVARWVAAAPEPAPQAPRRYAEITPPASGRDDELAAALDALPYRPADAVLGNAETIGGGVDYGVSAPIRAGTYLLQAVCVGQGMVEFAVYQEEDPNQAADAGASVMEVPVPCAGTPLPVAHSMPISGEAIHVSIGSASDTVGALVWQVIPD